MTIRERVIAEISLADVARETSQLWPSPSGLRCECPKHPDVRKSLYLGESRNFFFCFSCGWNGDTVAWTMGFLELDEAQAVALLSQRLREQPGPH
ncbi:CHC2 zinc finger domain-containing protein [Sphingomonas sp. LB3N6]|uniref:CHC2 zinc finger domain-containing protein n=1 Tax=Sphingomonas fucosidasi TaxID=3096164 RepID=UPI002FCC05B9